MRSPKSSGRSAYDVTDPGWWVRDRRGEVVLAQPPNAPLSVWLGASAARRLAPRRLGWLRPVGRGALALWAVEELVSGVTPLRRAMGAVTLAGTVRAATR